MGRRGQMAVSELILWLQGGHPKVYFYIRQGCMQTCPAYPEQMHRWYQTYRFLDVSPSDLGLMARLLMIR